MLEEKTGEIPVKRYFAYDDLGIDGGGGIVRVDNDDNDTVTVGTSKHYNESG